MKGANYPLVLHDGFRRDSKRPGQRNDCAVRAVGIAARLDYDNAYDMLANGGRKSCQGFDLAAWLKKDCPKSAKKVSVIGLKPSTFSGRYSKGSYIVTNDTHCWAVIDGIHYDLIRVLDTPLEEAWRIF